MRATSQHSRLFAALGVFAFVSVAAVSVTSYFALASGAIWSSEESDSVVNEDEFFLGKRRSEYLEEIDNVSDDRISEFLDEVLLSEEYKNRVYDDVRIIKHIDTIRFYISNKRYFNRKREDFIREVINSYSFISGTNAVEVFELDSMKKIESQFEIQIFTHDEIDMRKIIHRIVKSGGFIQREFLSAKYCFAMTWSGENRKKIANSLVFLIDREEWSKYRSCVFEELLHAFGFKGDSNVIHNSVMSHSESIEFLHGIDLFALRVLYSDEVTAGMRKQDFEFIKKRVIAKTRRWFEQCFIVNGDCDV